LQYINKERGEVILMEGQLFIYAINETQEVWQDLGTGRFYIQDGRDRVSISGQ